MLRQQFPRAARVYARGAQVADRDPDRERPIEAGMREKYVAARVYRFEQTLVEAVELRRRQREPARLRAKADGAERHGRKPFEVGMLIHTRGKLAREPDVLAQHLAQTRRAKMPKDHPKL